MPRQPVRLYVAACVAVIFPALFMSSHCTVGGFEDPSSTKNFDLCDGRGLFLTAPQTLQAEDTNFSLEKQFLRTKEFLSDYGIYLSGEKLADLSQARGMGLSEAEALSGTLRFVFAYLDILQLVLITPKPATHGCRQACSYRHLFSKEDVGPWITHMSRTGRQVFDLENEAPKPAKHYVSIWGNAQDELEAMYLPSIQGAQNYREALFFYASSARLARHHLERSSKDRTSSEAQMIRSIRRETRELHGTINPFNPRFHELAMVFDLNLGSKVVTTNLTSRHLSTTVMLAPLQAALQRSGVRLSKANIAH